MSVQAEVGQWNVRAVIERIPELGARLYYGYVKLLTINFWWAELEMAINSFFPSRTLILLCCNSNSTAKLHYRDRSPVADAFGVSQWAYWELVKLWPLLKHHMPTFSFSNPLLYSPLSTPSQAVCFNSWEAAEGSEHMRSCINRIDSSYPQSLKHVGI